MQVQIIKKNYSPTFLSLGKPINPESMEKLSDGYAATWKNLRR